MTKLRKILFTLGTTGTGIVSLATMISCAKPTELAKTDISEIQELVNTRKAEIDKAKNEQKEVKKMNIALVTGIGGHITDGSFNQSLWEAISQHSRQVGYNENIVLESKKEDEVKGKYTSLLNQKQNVWVLTSYQHREIFSKWLKEGNNRSRLESKGILVIGVDWTLGENEISKGHFISLQYKTDEAGWMAGYASANYLAEKYPTEESKRILAAFGGGTGPGVTDFIAGFVAGVKAYNSIPGNKISKFYQDTISLDLGFNPTEPGKDEIVKGIVNATKTPQIILPVSGPFTKSVLKAISDQTNSKTLVIGVDSNQAKLFKDSKDRFFTSIEKRLGSSLYNVLTDLFLKKGTESEYIPNFVWANEQNPNNTSISLGVNKDFVGLSASELTDQNEKQKVNTILENARLAFEAAKLTNTLGIPKMLDKETDNENQKTLDNLIKEINNQTQK